MHLAVGSKRDGILVFRQRRIVDADERRFHAHGAVGHHEGEHVRRRRVGDAVADREHEGGFPDPPGGDPPPRDRLLTRRIGIQDEKRSIGIDLGDLTGG